MKTSVNELNKEMRLNKLILSEYIRFKEAVQDLGYDLNLTEKKSKNQRNVVQNLYTRLNIPSCLKSLFISNLYIYDEEEFINQIEEAKRYGCSKETYANYLKANYNIDEKIYKLKLNELETYMNYFSQTTIADRIKNIVKETKVAVPVSNINYGHHNEVTEERIKEYLKEIA